MVDSRLLKKGEDYTLLPDRYTIFITEKDCFGRKKPIYHAQNKVPELDDAPLGDGVVIIYVNGEFRDTETAIGRLMHDF